MPFFGRSKKKKATGADGNTKKLSVAERRARRKEQRQSTKKSLYRIEEQVETLNEAAEDDEVIELISDDEVMNEDPFESPKKLDASSTMVLTHNTSPDDTIEIANGDDVLEQSMDENTLSPEKAKDFFLVNNTTFETHMDGDGKHHFNAALKDARQTKDPDFEESRLDALEAAVASGRISLSTLSANDRRALQIKRELAKKHTSVTMKRSDKVKAEVQQQNSAFRAKEYNLMSEIKTKNRMIDRLSQEVDKLSHSLKNCGREIVRLRQGKQSLQENVDTLNRSLEETKQVTTSLNGPITEDTVRQIPQSDRGRVILMLGEKLKQERETNLHYTEKIKGLRFILGRMVKRDQEHSGLKDAHMSQAVYIQQLQEQCKEMPKIQKAVQIQEKTIKRLENMLELQVSTTQALRKRMLQEAPEAGGIATSSPAVKGTDLSRKFEQKVHELQAMIRSKDSRIQSLEDQLVKNARLFAKEATDLKLRIQEYQMTNELTEEAF